MPRVLISPAAYSISNSDYGKTYNILNNICRDDLNIDAIVSAVEHPINNSSVRIHELNAANKTGYYLRAFRHAHKHLANSNVDVYHHMNLSYRWFNPLLLAGLQGDTPTVLGPCQAGHDILAEEFNLILKYGLGREIPRRVSDPVYRGIQRIRAFSLDPPREFLFRKTLQAADRIIVVHEDARDFYANFVDPSKLEVIPLGVNPDDFEFHERKDTKSLVAIGSLRERKGYDILLRALASLTNNFPDAHLHIFGDGPQRERLAQQVRNLNLEDNVSFHGYVDQDTIKQYLAKARAFVHPSRSESFSLVRLEAMANGCPIVATDTDGAREMIREGKEGFIVEPERPNQITEALERIFADFDLTRELGRRARQRVVEKYAWEVIGRKYLKVYDTITE